MFKHIVQNIKRNSAARQNKLRRTLIKMLQARSISHAIKILIANVLRLKQNAAAFFHLHFLTYFACNVWIFDKQRKNKMIKSFCERKMREK